MRLINSIYSVYITPDECFIHTKLPLSLYQISEDKFLENINAAIREMICAVEHGEDKPRYTLNLKRLVKISIDSLWNKSYISIEATFKKE